MMWHTKIANTAKLFGGLKGCHYFYPENLEERQKNREVAATRKSYSQQQEDSILREYIHSVFPNVR